MKTIKGVRVSKREEEALARAGVTIQGQRDHARSPDQRQHAPVLQRVAPGADGAAADLRLRLRLPREREFGQRQALQALPETAEAERVVVRD